MDHKTSPHGRARSKPISPKTQMFLRPFLSPDLHASSRPHDRNGSNVTWSQERSERQRPPAPSAPENARSEERATGAVSTNSYDPCKCNLHKTGGGDRCAARAPGTPPTWWQVGSSHFTFTS